MRFGSTAKVLLKCKLKYYRISECQGEGRGGGGIHPGPLEVVLQQSSSQCLRAVPLAAMCSSKCLPVPAVDRQHQPRQAYPLPWICPRLASMPVKPPESTSSSQSQLKWVKTWQQLTLSKAASPVENIRWDECARSMGIVSSHACHCRSSEGRKGVDGSRHFEMYALDGSDGRLLWKQEVLPPFLPICDHFLFSKKRVKSQERDVLLDLPKSGPPKPLLYDWPGRPTSGETPVPAGSV